MAMMAAVLLGVLLLGVLLVTWVTSGEGYTLTVEKPTGGSVLGPYISCGTIGSDCETTVSPGNVIALQAQPDEGYVLAGYVGDCAPAGRVAMDGPRTCGAQFRALSGSATERHRLTIDVPTGGTIYSLEGIVCGTDGQNCAIEVAHGGQVTLDVQADAGFQFQQYTGACAPAGTTTMTAPQTCGAVFARFVQAPVPLPTGGLTAGQPDRRPAPPSPAANGGATPRVTDVASGAGGTSPPTPPSPKPAPVAPSGPSSSGSGGTAAAGGGAPVIMPGPATAAEGPSKSPVEIAHAEISRALENYRAAYSRMDVPAMKRIHPSMESPRFEQQFRDLRSVEYTYAGPPEFSDLDLRAGTVRARLGVKIVMEPKAGGKQKPLEHQATFVLKRVEESAVWTVERIAYR